MSRHFAADFYTGEVMECENLENLLNVMNERNENNGEQFVLVQKEVIDRADDEGNFDFMLEENNYSEEV